MLLFCHQQKIVECWEAKVTRNEHNEHGSY